MTKYWVDPDNGRTVGMTSDDGKPSQVNAVEVPIPYENGNQVWDFVNLVWSPPPSSPSRADNAERTIRTSPAMLALGRIATGNDTLTEDALVALARSKLS